MVHVLNAPPNISIKHQIFQTKCESNEPHILCPLSPKVFEMTAQRNFHAVEAVTECIHCNYKEIDTFPCCLTLTLPTFN
jgi:hypothetical protein